MAQARSKLGFARCGLPPRSRGGRSRDSDGDGNVQISPVTQSVSSDGSLGSVSITASAPTCAWTSASSADWLVVLRNSSGTGSGTLDYGVCAKSPGRWSARARSSSADKPSRSPRTGSATRTYLSNRISHESAKARKKRLELPRFRGLRPTICFVFSCFRGESHRPLPGPRV
jgi:hypothetical protein